MKNLVVFPKFHKIIANGFGVIPMDQMERFLEGLNQQDDKMIASTILIAENDDFPYYSGTYGVRQDDGLFNSYVVVNESDFVVMDKVIYDITLDKDVAYIHCDGDLEFAVTRDEIIEFLRYNSWRTKGSPKLFFESESLNIENLSLPYTFLHSHENFLNSQMVYLMVNEFFNLDMLNELATYTNARLNTEYEDAEIYDEDLFKIKLSDMFKALTTANGERLNVTFNGLNIYNPKNDLVVNINGCGETISYLVRGNYNDAEIFDLRDMYLAKINSKK